jgi:predicted nuclease of predicted toxin-antitoxin system
MRFLIDECAIGPLIAALRNAGHDVRAIIESDASISDFKVAELAIEEQRVLITQDYGFGELVIRRGMAIPGLIILNLDSVDLDERVANILGVIEERAEALSSDLTIIAQRRARFRPLRKD